MTDAAISQEKIRRLEALTDDRGVFAAVAIDQRTSLERAIARAKGVEERFITDEMMRELKLAVSKALTPHASAIQLDTEWGLPAAEARAPGVGLLLSYERSGYDLEQPGRAPALLANMSVRRLKELGADGVKALLYYTPFEKEHLNDRKHAFIERIGAECQAEHLPFFLTLIGYDPAGGDAAALAKRRPEIVAESVRELSKERYGVDVLQIQPPVDMRFAEGSSVFEGRSVYTKSRALEHFRSLAEAAQRPFVFSSAGVSGQELTESLHWAAEAGVNFAGVSCGRSVWSDGVKVFGEKGVAAFEAWLEDRGVRNIDLVNAALANAGSWYSFYGASSAQALAD